MLEACEPASMKGYAISFLASALLLTSVVCLSRYDRSSVHLDANPAASLIGASRSREATDGNGTNAVAPRNGSAERSIACRARFPEGYKFLETLSGRWASGKNAVKVDGCDIQVAFALNGYVARTLDVYDVKEPFILVRDGSREYNILSANAELAIFNADLFPPLSLSRE